MLFSKLRVNLIHDGGTIGGWVPPNGIAAVPRRKTKQNQGQKSQDNAFFNKTTK